MSLPKAAAQLATYSTATLSFSSASTATAAARYTIEAISASGAAKSAPADITTSNATVNFTFP